MKISSKQVRWLAACGLVLSATLMGCGGGKTTSPVSGKVAFNGKPVTGGSLTFTPIAASGEKEPGKPATGQVGSDGSYTLGTHKANDGAVVGKHRVNYSPPQMELPDGGKNAKPGDVPPKSGFEFLVPKQSEVEVKPGSNTIEIELVPPGK